MWCPICDVVQLERPTLSNFLLHKTKVKELCIILDCGYNCAACYIDHEDLFIRNMPSDLLDRKVEKDYWGDLSTSTGTIKVHYIELEY